ncbi:metal cation symporter ZIP14 [Octopus bimaculoides]|uniref:EF-hand domain-containing protein n=1 Tax=Octopus bimaculoides TaxID=37653 RepID=A0A0L8HHD6_OCTBM|nr:metal cation symporter ZIP14 [Octopus bimaculoides]|eukprot:XP_014772341.1 PREDICTED: zinc transporter ZIP14-like [Octopus bimaculoides]
MCPVFTGKYCILCFLFCLLLSPSSPSKSEKTRLLPPPPSPNTTPPPQSSHNARHEDNYKQKSTPSYEKTSLHFESEHQISLPHSRNTTLHYIKILFDKYGEADTLTLDGLKLLLSSLGLQTGQNVSDLLSSTSKSSVPSNPSFLHSSKASTEGLNSVQGARSRRHVSSHISTSDSNNNGKNNRPSSACMSLTDYLSTFHFTNTNKLTSEQFISLCPALLQQLDSKVCNHSEHNHQHQHHDDHNHEHTGHTDATSHEHNNTCPTRSVSNIPYEVWLWSFLAVLGISSVGLFGVCLIPFMQRVFYNHLLQWLVAVAIGALSGDALLHLLPHALVNNHNHSQCEESHSVPHDRSSILKGMVGLLGIVVFFIMERVMTIVTLMRTEKRNKKKKRNCSHVSTISEGDSSIGNKLSSHRSRSSHYQSCEDVVMMVHPNRALKDLAEDSHADMIECNQQQVQQSDEEHTTMMSPSHGPNNQNTSNFYQQHGHSHVPCIDADGHNIPAMAWIVVIGDGIHNLCDGLAIGAAFGFSTTVGCSTAIAVLCHELPHEIGDFAVLLRAGMSLRKAITYNIISSVLCLFGMIIGVLLGNINSVTVWIFAAVGGMFLYIALVDMLPEISSVETREGEHPFLHLFIQCLGLLFGSGIMWLIAYYEHDLINAF